MSTRKSSKSKSSNMKPHHILGKGKMRARRVERVLWDLANLKPATEEKLQALFTKYPDIFVGNTSDRAVYVGLGLRAEALGELLRRAWSAPDARRREWYLYSLTAFYAKLEEDRKLEDQEVGDRNLIRGVLGSYVEPGDRLFELRIVEPPAEMSPIEEVVLYFRKNARRARRCLNPNCQKPYFLYSRKGQRYCTEKCSTPAKRKAKLRWWHENRGRSLGSG